MSKDQTNPPKITGKRCPKCDTWRTVSEFYKGKNRKHGLSSLCKFCCKEYRAKNREKNIKYLKEWNKNNKDKVRDSEYNRKYGISLEDYNKMLESQKNSCAICGCEETTIYKKKGETRSLCVDHNHTTGNVRALLCGKCNQAIGLLMDDADLIDKAAEYIRKHKQ